MTPKRVAKRLSWSRTCVDTTMVMPFSRLRRCRVWRISWVAAGSRPLNGSSSSKSSGVPTMASAMPMRCFMPNEKLRVCLEPVLARFTISRSSWQCSLGFLTPRAVALYIRLSMALIRSRRPGASMMAPTPVGPSQVAGLWPRTSSSPEVGLIRPQTIFIVVDLPAPLRPTKP